MSPAQNIAIRIALLDYFCSLSTDRFRMLFLEAMHDYFVSLEKGGRVASSKMETRDFEDFPGSTEETRAYEIIRWTERYGIRDFFVTRALALAAKGHGDPKAAKRLQVAVSGGDSYG